MNSIKITAILALLCMAFFIIQPLTAKSYIYKTFREISRIQMMFATRNWNQIEGEHFIVRYHGKDKETAGMVLNVAEKSYIPVTASYGYEPRHKILVLVYPSQEALGKSFGWAADESAMGVYWAGVIRILSPSEWIDEDSLLNISETFEKQGPIAHELTHLMVDYVTDGNYTRWFTEGLAQYEEVKIMGYRMEQRNITNPAELYEFSLMDKEFDNLPDQSLAYFQSLEAIIYLVETYGEDSLKEILVRLSKNQTLDESFKSVLGIPLSQFEHDFKLWLAEKDC